MYIVNQVRSNLQFVISFEKFSFDVNDFLEMARKDNYGFGTLDH